MDATQKTLDDLRAALADALRRIESLERQAAARQRQQIQLPLDPASRQVLKDAMRAAGFTL